MKPQLVLNISLNRLVINRPILIRLTIQLFNSHEDIFESYYQRISILLSGS